MLLAPQMKTWVGSIPASSNWASQLDRRADVAERREHLLVEGEGGDHEGLPAGGFEGARLLVEQRLDLFHAVDVDHGHIRAHQAVEQQIALHPRPLDAMDQHQRNRETVLARRRRDLPAPVRLRVGARDHGVGARLQDLGEGELQMTRLVAAERQSGEIVPLDVEGAHADRLGEPWAGVERRRQMREPDARMRAKPGGELAPRHRCLRMCLSHRHSTPSRLFGHPIAGGKRPATDGDSRVVHFRHGCISIPYR